MLAGGEGRRLGNVDKAELVVRGARLLDTVLAACAGARTTVVVGPRRATARAVVWTREDPPGGGPCAGLAAAVPLLSAPTTVLLAVDLPLVTPELVRRLAAAAPVVAVDDDGRPQWLLSAWPTALLAGVPAGGSLRSALDPLGWSPLAVGEQSRDVDVPADLAP